MGPNKGSGVIYTIYYGRYYVCVGMWVHVRACRHAQ